MNSACNKSKTPLLNDLIRSNGLQLSDGREIMRHTATHVVRKCRVGKQNNKKNCRNDEEHFEMEMQTRKRRMSRASSGGGGDDGWW